MQAGVSLRIDFEFDDEDLKGILKKLPNKIVIPAVIKGMNVGTRESVKAGYKELSKKSYINQGLLKRKKGVWPGRISASKVNKRDLKAGIFFRTSFGVPVGNAAKAKGISGEAREPYLWRAVKKAKLHLDDSRTFFNKVYNSKKGGGGGRWSLFYRAGDKIKEVQLPIGDIATNAAKNEAIKTFYSAYEKELLKQIKKKIDKL